MRPSRPTRAELARDLAELRRAARRLLAATRELTWRLETQQAWAELERLAGTEER